MKLISALLTLALLITWPASASDVKLSRSGICHDTTSAFYKRTKNFTAFANMEACINAGGRPPKAYRGKIDKPMDRAVNEATREGRAFTKMYNREDYPHWSKVSGCVNTRHHLLKIQSQVPVTYTNAKKCSVKTGKWYGPYTNKTYTRASDVDIDHIVALLDGHKKGAHSWSRAKKERFANDPENLLIVDDSTNQAKGAKGLTEWLPPNKKYRCTYIKKYDHIINKYGLSYSAKEIRTVNKMKQACNL